MQNQHSVYQRYTPHCPFTNIFTFGIAPKSVNFFQVKTSAVSLNEVDPFLVGSHIKLTPPGCFCRTENALDPS